MLVFHPPFTWDLGVKTVWPICSTNYPRENKSRAGFGSEVPCHRTCHIKVGGVLKGGGGGGGVRVRRPCCMVWGLKCEIIRDVHTFRAGSKPAIFTLGPGKPQCVLDFVFALISATNSDLRSPVKRINRVITTYLAVNLVLSNERLLSQALQDQE